MNEPDAQRRIRDLSALLEVSKDMAASIELVPLLKQVERAALQVLDCERATVFLYDDCANELCSKVATGTRDIRFSANRGIAGEALRSRAVINVPDAYADPRFNPEVDRQTGFRTCNLLAFCLVGFDGKVVGVLQALNKKQGCFTKADEGLAVTLSSLAGVAVQRQMLLEQYAEKQRLERDLAVAREIQQSLLPQANPQVAGYDIAGWNKPADETGGDCYDFVELEGGRLGLMLADATGHGIGPALCVSECRALLRASIISPDDLAVGMQRTNALLGHDMPAGRFVTTFFGILDPQAHRVEYVSAGHGPLLLAEAASGNNIELPASTLPMGVRPELGTTVPAPIDLAPGDTLLLVTDGFFEWVNPAKEAYGTQRIFDLARANPETSSADLIRMLHEEVLAFAEGTPQNDDLTAIVVRRR
ncbi:MAG TPA: GAF domain-containing SpoIIE family protein phosphatase [Phycisphaerae bacterium]|nr:GAF domain-containing SpoIIE family protein phosphatase [Phycisphaerae bacterium]